MEERSPFMGRTHKRTLGILHDVDMLQFDQHAMRIVLDPDTATPELILAALRTAYCAGYEDAHADDPPFTANEAREPWARLPT